jgi:hypothetical protein
MARKKKPRPEPGFEASNDLDQLLVPFSVTPEKAENARTRT